MNTGRFRRAEEIYFAVIEMPLADRAGAIAKLCEGNSDLRAEVESLLGHSDAVAQFLATPAMGSRVIIPEHGDDTTFDELVGSTIGNYRIERSLASGGMGTVYLASRADAQYSQQVAIKVVKRGMDSDELLRRFRRERQTLAALSHPNIARLLDGGATADGRPYLVMEFVDGVPLDRYCAEHQMGIGPRLQLFLRICHAVGYAHRNLVVHRDLKPNNILVTPDGSPKLLDFGIATVLASVGTGQMTSPHEQRLTPEYASPEQVDGRQVTTASDVYSLGIILYELLSGSRPYAFASRTAIEIERVVRTQVPLAPSAAATRSGKASPEIDPSGARLSPPSEGSPDRLKRKLRGDLDNIVLMAVRKEPERRYGTVEQLALDIERYLQNRPVAARKDTFTYRAGKFLRRNAVACTFAAAIAVSLVAGLAGVLWQTRIADRERDAALLARDQSEAIYGFLQKMLAEADPGRAGPNATLRDWVDATAAGLQGQLSDQPLVRAAMQAALGRMYVSLGVYDRADAELRTALAERTRLLPADHHDIAESKDDLATLRYAQGRLAEAEDLLRSSLSTVQQIRNGENADHAEVLNDLGAVLRSAGKLDEAEETHRHALEIRNRLFGNSSLEAAESLNNLAGVYRSRAQAEDTASKAEPKSERSDHDARKRAALNEAVKFATESYRVRVAILNESHPVVAQSLQNMAVMKAENEEFDAALDLMQRSLKSYEGVFTETHPAIIRALGSVAFIMKRKGMLTEAEPVLRRAISLADRRFPPADSLVLTIRLQLGRLLDSLEKYDEAEQLLVDVYTLSSNDSRLGNAHKDSAAALNEHFVKLHRPDEAAKFAPVGK